MKIQSKKKKKRRKKPENELKPKLVLFMQDTSPTAGREKAQALLQGRAAWWSWEREAYGSRQSRECTTQL